MDNKKVRLSVSICHTQSVTAAFIFHAVPPDVDAYARAQCNSDRSFHPKRVQLMFS
jgi:hypothetical protein